MVSILLPRFLKRKYGFLTNLFHLVKEKWFLAGSRPHASIVQGKCLPFCRGNQSTRSGLSLPVPLEGYRSWSHLCSLSQKLHNSRMEMDISQVTFVAAEEGDENQFTCHVRCLCHTTEQAWWDVYSILCCWMAQSDQGSLLWCLQRNNCTYYTSYHKA